MGGQFSWLVVARWTPTDGKDAVADCSCSALVGCFLPSSRRRRGTDDLFFPGPGSVTHKNCNKRLMDAQVKFLLAPVFRARPGPMFISFRKGGFPWPGPMFEETTNDGGREGNPVKNPTPQSVSTVRPAGLSHGHGRRRPPPSGLLPGRRLRALLPPILAAASPPRRYAPRLLLLPPLPLLRRRDLASVSA